MKSFEIKGNVRPAVGKKDTKRLRYEEKTPCVLYGGENVVHFHVNRGDLRKVLNTPNVYIIALDIDGEKQNAIVQDAQFHPVSDEVIHVDFLQIFDDKPVKIDVPIETKGFAKGLKEGGKLKINLRRLRVKALPKHLPDTIEVNVEDLSLGDSFKVGELEVKNLEFLNAKDVPVASIVVTRAARAAGLDSEEEGAEGEAAEGAEGGAPAAEGAEAPAES